MSTRLSRIDRWEDVAREAGFQPAKMASLCCISSRQLQRYFKEHFHATPSHWVRGLQCHLAKELILQGFSSKAAAAELKFGNASHFCREFKKIFDAPPQIFSPGFQDHQKCRP
jgi:AraC-like DNA-binding protein